MIFLYQHILKKIEKRVSALKTIYDQKIIFLKPALLDEKGFEEWDCII